jgi:rhodanese-related sulfurtransferase
MRTFWLVAALALVPVAACSKDDGPAAAQPVKQVAEVSVAELDALIAAGACTPVDANGDVTRKKRGVIPGAVRLSDYETYLPAELPADKARALVFYCANQQCGASHTAAEKAVLAGYRDVRVLPAGIFGWADAGKTVEPG